MPVELVNLRVSVREQQEPPVFPPVSATPAAEIREKTMHGVEGPVSLVPRSSLGSGDSITGPALIV